MTEVLSPHSLNFPIPNNTVINTTVPFTIPLYTDVAFVILTSSVATCSIVAASLVIWTYLVLEDIRTTSRKLLLFASAADIVTATCYFIGSLWYIFKRQFETENIHMDGNGTGDGSDGDVICFLIGGISSYSQSASFWWNMATALYLYLEIVHGKRIVLKKWLVLTHFICWGVPAIPIIAAASQNVFGFDDELMPACTISRAAICWLKGGLGFREYTMWTIVTLKGTELVAFFEVLVLYLMIACHVSRTSTSLMRDFQFNREDEKMLFDQTIKVVLRANRKLIAVPLLFIGVRIWGTLRLVVMIAWMPRCTTPYPATEWIKVFFMLMEGAGNSAQGLANGVIFCAISKRVRSRVKQICCSDIDFKSCCCNVNSGLQEFGHSESFRNLDNTNNGVLSQLFHSRRSAGQPANPMNVR